VPPFDLEEIDRLLTTTRAVRRRLDLKRAVADDVLRDCIRLATHAPNASNQQTWRWLVVTDRDLRRQVGEEYRRIIVPPVEAMRRQKAEAGDTAGVRISDSVLYLAEHMGEVPALVIPCFEFRADASTHLAFTARMFASVYPAVWSFQLALRSRGLGSVLTTAHLLDDAPLQRLLRIPPHYTQTCLIPVAYTVGADFGPARRLPVEEVIGWNGWSAPTPGSVP
jgi:nitroreductase